MATTGPTGEVTGVDIAVDRDSATPIYLQILNRIRAMILAGELPPGFRLPPERRLADAPRPALEDRVGRGPATRASARGNHPGRGS